MNKYINNKRFPITMIAKKLSIMITLMLFMGPTFAQQNSQTSTAITADLVSYSAGQLANSINQKPAIQMVDNIKNRISSDDSDQIQNKALALTRDEMIKLKQQRERVNQGSDTSRNKRASRNVNDGSFVIYEGYTQLIEDLDIDGYYQTFSVTFDADFISYSPYDSAIVYAELYLSENGGPWQHYYTTDSFVIQGESTNDNFEVYSTLSQGFNPNQYDVLIDLYEEGYPYIVASYSSDDSNALFALPLESSDYDITYYEEIHVYGGSSSTAGILIITLMLAFRKIVSAMKLL
jgi:hypothetical protein